MAGVNVPTSATIREDLTGYLAGFNPDLSGFAAHRVLPPFMVNKTDGVFYRIGAEAWLKSVSTRRARYGSTSKSTYDKTQDTWLLEDYSHGEANDVTDDRSYQTRQQAEQVRTIRTAGTILRDYENVVASQLFNETNYPLSGNTGFTASALWTTFATSTPVANVQAAKQLIRATTGMEANMVVIPKANVEAASNSASVLDRVKGYDSSTRSGDLNAALWAELFNIPVEGLIVTNSFRNTANQGLAVTTSPIWSNDYIGVGVNNSSPDLEMPQLGRSFMLSSEYVATGTDSTGTQTIADAQIVVDEYSDPDTKTNVLRSSMFRHGKRLVTNCWVLVKVR